MSTLIRFNTPESAMCGEPAPEPARATAGLRRLAAVGLFAFALGSGGAFGGVAATRLLPESAAASVLAAPAAPAMLQPAPPAAPAMLQPAPPVVPPAMLQPVPPAAPPTAANVAGQVYKTLNSSVVQVVVAGRARSGRMGSGAGSGFVVDPTGHILTNNHVVEGARAISVRFRSGVTREAEVVGADRGNDLALLKVDLPEGVPAAPLGDSDSVDVGELAIAIGSPFGLEQTVTQGIVSATNRVWAPGSGRVRRGLLQTDAAINPGNSGGPLLNARGEVIGVTSMIESPVRGNVGVGFAVPINTAKRLLPQLEAGARLEPVWLGISGQVVDSAIARDQGLPVQEGVLILSVVPDGPAAHAGLQGGQGGAEERIPLGGDVVVALNGTPVKDLDQLTQALLGQQPGDTVTVAIVREGQRQDVPVTLQAWPAETP